MAKGLCNSATPDLSHHVCVCVWVGGYAVVCRLMSHPSPPPMRVDACVCCGVQANETVVKRMRADEAALADYFKQHMKPDKLSSAMQELIDMRTLMGSSR